ncbi:MAG: type IV pilus assembly protein PilM [Candidatus Sungiibacteriota bacterium]|uniref:Type IV pilus assembly protein PilM n=1 Tax=Candidatus Sungiibacteriota bacterium TaxID=2750080 RepID=A0A7T5RK02_9BACT|nr:MAG: type IV pilus assembly protein PilM [Candidatus Sungbacteria bacterium]
MKEKIVNLVRSLIKFPVVGLDISDTSIKYIKLRSGGLLSLFGEFTIPANLIVGGEVKDEEALVKILSSWLGKEGRELRSSFVVASLPEEKSFLRLIQLPRVKRDEVAGAVRWEIEANVPMPVEDLVFDYEIVEPLEDHLDHFDVVITAYPKTTVDSYVRVLSRVGFRPVALELELQAVIRAVVPEVRTHEAKIIVDMGRNRTSFIIVSGGAIVFTRTVDLGGRVIEENIVKALAVSEEKATALKKEFGLNKKAFEGKIFTALSPLVSTLAEELKHAVAYYESHAAHLHGASPGVASILLSGGDANLYGLDTYLASALKIPVHHTDPFIVLRKMGGPVVPPIPKNQSLAYATAIGLALRGAR